ncbi:MAG: DNA polymerase I [[Candidatus Thermochlorobacteriaceae] bacterium GBChlB]|nr:MAG: DNA polymerase I [[Candidatus Thermochlorobacteriaceae] bacterium GBChlB]
MSIQDAPKKPTLFLLDGMALVYRSYYALMPARMQTKTGFPTGATFGFTNTLLKLIDNYKPDYIAVAFDSKEKTFRHEKYPLYKAQRPIPPDDLIQQLEKIYAIVTGCGVKMLKMPGFEADDIMGTLAKKYEQQCNVFLVTPDKDFSQLVSESVKILKPAKEDDKFDLYGRQQIKEKYGVYPEQFVEMLTLMGDSSDNIPGAEGVGPKTAASLISEYQTIENIYKNLPLIKKPKLRQSLQDAREHLQLGKFLVTIKVDMSIETSLDELRPQSPDAETLAPIFEELEFRQFLSRLKRPVKSSIDGDAADAPEPNDLSFDFGANVEESYEFSMPQPHTLGAYTLIDEPIAFSDFLEKLRAAKEFSFDTETTSLDALDADLVCISFSTAPREAYSIYCAGEQLTLNEIVRALKPFLENLSVRKVGQNLKYDMLVLKKYGIEVSAPIFDTMLASYVLNPDKPHNLDDMAEDLLKFRTVRYDELVGTGKSQKSIYDVPLDQLRDYACQDADIALQLKVALSAKLADEPALERICTQLEFPLVSVLADMESYGIRIDTAVLSEISKSLSEAIDAASKDIFRLADAEFNIDSPKQLGEILFDKMNIPPKKRTKTGFSTDVRVLEELAEEYPIATKILEYRSLQKLKSTYVDALPELIRVRTGKVHTSFNQSVAATGRLSSSNPNLQNIPIRTEIGREIRKAFVPSDKAHVILSADYSQIELRIAAELSGDPTMTQAFQDGDDIHAATAKLIFETNAVTKDMRRKAKEVNFGVLYGIQPFGLAQRLDISQSEAKTLIENYKAKYPKIFELTTRILEQARLKGYVETVIGRRRYFTDINSKNFSIRNAAERAAVNTPIQGTAADMIKLAMIDIAAALRQRDLRSRMMLQVHDELVFDMHISEQDILPDLVKNIMIGAAAKAGIKKIPIEVETGVGQNWLDAH